MVARVKSKVKTESKKSRELGTSARVEELTNKLDKKETKKLKNQQQQWKPAETVEL